MKNKIDIEIIDIAPTLASLEKHNPFVVPDGYFLSLENHILDAVDKKPILSVSMPEGYFESLSDKVLDRIQSEEKTKIVPFYKRRWLSIAASFVILFGAGYLLNTQLNSSTEINEFVFDIEPEDALEYLLENDNLYLSDLMTLDFEDDDFNTKEPQITDFDDADIDELLNELDQDDLEELL